MAQPADFITFLVEPKKGVGNAEVTVRLKRPVCLYDERRLSPYVQVRARAARIGKRELGLHPCASVNIHPRDWSDGVDQLTDAVASCGEYENAEERADEILKIAALA